MKASTIAALMVWAGCAGPALGFDGIRVTLLSAGGGVPGDSAPGPGTLVEAGEETLLFDCGPGTLQRLEQAGVAVGDLTAVFMTRLDAVHSGGCSEVWGARFRNTDAAHLPVWGPPGTRGLFEAIAGAVRPGGKAGGVAFDVTDNVIYQPEGVTVTAYVAGDGDAASAFGYRVDSHRRAVALAGDGRYSENAVRTVTGVHLLLHEVNAGDGIDRSREDGAAAARTAQSTPEDAARVFRGARPYLAVYSFIMPPGFPEDELLRRTRRTYRGPLHIGRDLMVIELQNEVQIRSSPSEPRPALR